MIETINVNGGNPGYHPQLYRDHYDELCKNRNINVALTVSEKAAIDKAKEDAKKAYCEKYLACLFVLVQSKAGSRDLIAPFITSTL